MKGKRTISYERKTEDEKKLDMRAEFADRKRLFELWCNVNEVIGIRGIKEG